MSGSTFQSFLQRAYWRGIPFFVETQQITKGRKTAVHDYPFRDGGWTEDLGRRQRIFQFTGHLVGDLAPVMQIALDAAIELKGPGLLVHPTLGAVKVALVACSSSVRFDRMRVIAVEFTFLEQGASLFPSILTDTLSKIVGTVSDALLAFGPEIAVGITALTAIVGAVGAVQSLSSSCSSAASDPTMLVALATALPPPDSDTSYGRYAAGNAINALPADATVASLQAQISDLRAALVVTQATALTAATNLSAQTATALATAIAAMVEATRAAMNNPADQIRTLLTLVTVNTTTDIVAATCRRCVLASLALACSIYQPASYDDGVAIRDLAANAIDVEITAAGDAGDDGSYGALRAMRAAVVADLTARAAALPLVITVTLPDNLPTLVVAYRLYKDASRSDQIAAETGVIHPAFLPPTIQVLAA